MLGSPPTSTRSREYNCLAFSAAPQYSISPYHDEARVSYLRLFYAARLQHQFLTGMRLPHAVGMHASTKPQSLNEKLVSWKIRSLLP
jgi:hypothetical protein